MISRIAIFLMISFAVISVSNAAPAPEASQVEVSEFVQVPPISVAMYNKRKRLAGTMTVIMQLKIGDADKRDMATKIMPRLRSAYTQETTKLALNFFDISRPVNANILGRSLQNVTNQVLKHGDARVLIGDIAVQKR
ncbi:MAG: hypothetical protein P8P98_01065 [Emcibacteraceae bacterium]|nr:hypothetical protein [Emcibacteraceae bacterium]MDG1994982.1 hypothetical protein [Emcibacteraceae bacterium]